MVKWKRLKTVWLSAFAGSNPVSHIFTTFKKRKIYKVEIVERIMGLENKFEKEFYEDKYLWRLKMTFEPEYALRSVLSIPKEKSKKIILPTILLETTRLAVYALGVYTIYQKILQ